MTREQMREMAEDAGEHPEPRRKSYDCADGFCGALDCCRCHPLDYKVDVEDESEE